MHRTSLLLKSSPSRRWQSINEQASYYDLINQLIKKGKALSNNIQLRILQVYNRLYFYLTQNRNINKKKRIQLKALYINYTALRRI